MLSTLNRHHYGHYPTETITRLGYGCEQGAFVSPCSLARPALSAG